MSSLNSWTLFDIHPCQKILCVTTGEIFPSQCEAARTYKIQQGNISKCLKGERKSAGKDPKTGAKLIWQKI